MLTIHAEFANLIALYWQSRPTLAHQPDPHTLCYSFALSLVESRHPTDFNPKLSPQNFITINTPKIPQELP